MKKLVCILIAASLPLFMGCSVLSADTETIYQGAAMEALLAGNYDSVATVKDIKTKGNIGLGTYTGLDGEMIVLDGTVYKVSKNGEVQIAKDDAGSPFYAVTTFDNDLQEMVQGERLDYSALKERMDSLRTRSDLPYALCIPCTLSSVKVRSEGPFEKPYPVLADAIKQQSVYEYTDISGTLVGFWFPDFMGNTNAAGYHLHFISDDLQKGGHVLELTLTDGKIEMDETENLCLAFSEYETVPLLEEASYK